MKINKKNEYVNVFIFDTARRSILYRFNLCSEVMERWLFLKSSLKQFLAIHSLLPVDVQWNPRPTALECLVPVAPFPLCSVCQLQQWVEDHGVLVCHHLSRDTMHCKCGDDFGHSDHWFVVPGCSVWLTVARSLTSLNLFFSVSC